MSSLIRSLAIGGLALAVVACSKSPPHPVPYGEDVQLQAWRPFAADSPWNTPIPANAVADEESDALIASFISEGALFINVDQWSVPVYYIDMAETPTREVYDHYTGVYGRGFEWPRAIPIPDDMARLNPSAGYIAIVDKTRALEWDLSQASKNTNGVWMTGFGVVTNLRGSGVSAPWNEVEQPNEAASALPSGFPLSAGLIRLDEIKTGRIPHALMIASPSIRSGEFVRPASTARLQYTGMAPSETGLPLGARLQLDPDFNIESSGLSPAGKIIARALQTYGAYVGDQAGANVLFAEAGPEQLAEWQGLLKLDELASVFSPEMMARHFRVIDMGEALPAEPVPAQP
ncbi:MAG: hypothetical protein V7741_01795 [Hyphomonas sp.]